jgi:transcriptional regulator with XRE-family HTH domain
VRSYKSGIVTAKAQALSIAQYPFQKERAMPVNKASHMFPITNDGDTIGGRISRARDALGYSLADVATQAGVRKETVAAWERDRAEPRTNKLVMLAGILNVSPTWLITGSGEGPHETKPVSDAEIMHMISEVKRLQAETNQAVIALEKLVLARA